MFCYDQAIVHNSQAIVHNSQAIVHNGQSSDFLFLTAKARKNANKQNMTLSQKSHHPVISVWKTPMCAPIFNETFHGLLTKEFAPVQHVQLQVYHMVK